MRIHILGICGTFMSGIAMLAKQQGHEVTGSDMNVYPPMSTQLTEQGITMYAGYDPAHIHPQVDCVLVGNAIKRGNLALEHIMAENIPYLSGPQWLYENILQARHVLAVAGTHGKTTTSSMLAHILTAAGLAPGFLIGGVPENFGVSATLGGGRYFVIEADEYDSAFFDKRAKFIHYRAKTMILNNLEYDHADIYPDLNAIKQQFHYLVKTLARNALIVRPHDDGHLDEVLRMGCYTPVVTFAATASPWQAALLAADGSAFTVLHQGKAVGEVHWSLLGKHNVANALAALAAAHHVNVAPEQAVIALAQFKNVKRRLEIKGQAKGIIIYDDFAHHPTAIQTTLAGLRAKIGDKARLIAVLEFGSYTMRNGVHRENLQKALSDANLVVCKNTEIEWGLEKLLTQFKKPTALYADVETLVEQLVPQLHAGDHVVIMSNSGFGGIHQKLITAIEKS